MTTPREPLAAFPWNDLIEMSGMEGTTSRVVTIVGSSICERLDRIIELLEDDNSE